MIIIIIVQRHLPICAILRLRCAILRWCRTIRRSAERATISRWAKHLSQISELACDLKIAQRTPAKGAERERESSVMRYSCSESRCN